MATRGVRFQASDIWDAPEERVPGEAGYRLVGTFGPGEIFRPTLFPGLEIPLDDLAG